MAAYTLGLMGKLPQELRDEIYDLVVADPDTRITAIRDEVTVAPNYNIETACTVVNQPYLSLACKQIREEVLLRCDNTDVHQVMIRASTAHAGKHVARVFSSLTGVINMTKLHLSIYVDHEIEPCESTKPRTRRRNPSRSINRSIRNGLRNAIIGLHGVKELSIEIEHTSNASYGAHLIWYDDVPRGLLAKAAARSPNWESFAIISEYWENCYLFSREQGEFNSPKGHYNMKSLHKLGVGGMTQSVVAIDHFEKGFGVIPNPKKEMWNCCSTDFEDDEDDYYEVVCG